MYDIISYVLSGILVLLGLVMVVLPKQSTKKELQDSEEALKKTRRTGVIVAILGIILLLIDIFL
ncbi:MAG: hypothetical protein K2N01_09705 [Lachnospiraceae bacterium]|nr:hypothetical protein [Lachnospiraceae bacterium]